MPEEIRTRRHSRSEHSHLAQKSSRKEQSSIAAESEVSSPTAAFDRPGAANILHLQSMVGNQAVKRLGTAEEIASAILFMMANSYMTGAVMTVDGGYTLT